MKFRYFRFGLSEGALALICVLTLLPLLHLLFYLFVPTPEVWAHVGPLLPGLIANTGWLLFGVLTGSCLLGTTLAWLTGGCEFPGRRFFAWALMLPLAIPAYVLGFVMVGLLDFSGPLQTGLRGWFGADFQLPAVRSLGGVILALTLALYPYVYLLARNAFLTQSGRVLEAGRCLGLSTFAVFWHVSLPMARPWIGAGLMLVAMETLADFGTVSVFNFETFTTAIYKAWFGLFSLPAAAQLSSFLVLFAFAALILEQRQRSRQRFYVATRSSSGIHRVRLQGLGACAAVAGTAGVLFLAFLLPLLQLLSWSLEVFASDWDARFVDYLFNSLIMAGLGSMLILVVAVTLSLIRRKRKTWLSLLLVRLATLGYSLPGTVLAVGVFLPVAWLDNQLIDAGKRWFDLEWAPLFGGGLLTLLLAYLIRFLAVGYGATDSALQRITPSMEDAAQSLGVAGFDMLRKVHFPLLSGGLFSAYLLAFVDIMKEMPITLLMRPFGWDNLAVRIFEMTAEGEWQKAALPSVVLVLAGLLPIYLLVRHTESKE